MYLIIIAATELTKKDIENEFQTNVGDYEEVELPPKYAASIGAPYLAIKHYKLSNQVFAFMYFNQHAGYEVRLVDHDEIRAATAPHPQLLFASAKH